MDAAGWDARYADAPMVWSAGPNALFASVVADWTPGRALDVASGEGRTAIWLASRGWQVRAVDFSAVGVDKGRERAAAQGLSVDWVVDDVTAAELGSGFDLVALLYLQLEHAQQAAVVSRCVQALAPGGRLVVVAHDLDNLEQGVGGPQDPSVLPTVELLRYWAREAHVERAEQVHRQTEAGTAIDVLMVARR
ncbi:class I SAM-dependent methyltransferase [Angustibacter sp. McL0619]|uniref:class I SAM-dependent methyltransferase n=1 Tax=Angustibacter sp. McL0619 TaxID=3415676 RepID=UPI003CF7B3EC